MERVYNFSAGPSAINEGVLKKAQEEMLCYADSGMSVMEMSHRSAVYDSIIKDAEKLLREILSIPDDYAVLFLQGGAWSQFAMVPMNLATKSGKIDLVVTGNWAKKAGEEASKYCKVNIVASSEDKNFNYIPTLDKTKFDKEADYFYICDNNTIYGTKYPEYPETGNVPLVADMSSCICSQEVDVSKFGLIFAGAQKNLGPAGLTIVIVRRDLIGHQMDITPTMFTYAVHEKHNSLFNTPPTYSIYICKLVLEWIKGLGGLKEMEKINKAKAKLLYSAIDESKMFKADVQGSSRSIMNVTFRTGDADLDAAFIKGATSRGLVNIKGYRTIGGMRASIYNAMPMEGVEKLVSYMKQFEAENK